MVHRNSIEGPKPFAGDVVGVAQLLGRSWSFFPFAKHSQSGKARIESISTNEVTHVESRISPVAA